MCSKGKSIIAVGLFALLLLTFGIGNVVSLCLNVHALQKDNLQLSTQINATVQELALAESTYDDEINLGYLGRYRITYYCAGSCCCGRYADGYTASGVVPMEGVTCAMEGFPIGTRVLIEGQIYEVQDRFGKPDKTDCIDIYVESHEKAVSLGSHQSEVYVLK